MLMKFFKNFAKLNLAILLLLIIACFSVIGTLIQQDRPLIYYLDSYSNVALPYGLNFAQVLLFLGWDHMYKTWWFFTLLILFAICLISCTFTQQLPILKRVRCFLFKQKETDFRKQEYSTKVGITYFISSLNKLKEKRYTICSQKNTVYAYKGVIGRFAPIIVHISMLIILFGVTIGTWGSFTSQELIAKGEIFQIQNTISKNFLTTILDVPIRVNDFWIEYDQSNTIKQFYSDVSILNNAQDELKRQTISVNYPMKFDSLTIYQTDWNIIGIRINLNSIFYQLPVFALTQVKNSYVGYIPFLPDGSSDCVIVLNKLTGSFGLYNSEGRFLGIYQLGERIYNNFDFSVLEIVTRTGLQIKSDPGIPLIYLGFGILMISSVISYLSFNQFWLAKEEVSIFISGISNRAKLALKLDFLSLALPVPHILKDKIWVGKSRDKSLKK
nr:Cytochrome c biogenesis protein [Meringosphaera mediterranea]WLD06248.1 Cytochrome c biogenesis protein [Meringosphaera mediterranea]